MNNELAKLVRGVLLFLLCFAAAWWVLDSIAENPGQTTIVWGQWVLEMQSATLLLAFIAGCILFYFCLRILLNVLGLQQRLLRARQRKLSKQAAQNLTQGLVQLAEGHWDEAERLLTQNVAYSETPLLNYLTAARAAHMQNKPSQRDELLRQAITSDVGAQVAVGVSRAEMQLADSQLEQAHATLLNLRGAAPQNRYVLKLYAKALFRQENWEQLFALLPELQQHDLLVNDSVNMRPIMMATLRGMFSSYAEAKQGAQLQQLWQQVPAEIRVKPVSKRLYANSLYQAGASEACAEFIVQSNSDINGAQDEELISLYGKLYRNNDRDCSDGGALSQAIAQAELWLCEQPENPVNLLLLGRLYRCQQNDEQAKIYYVNSLHQSPEAEAYLELAEILEGQGEYEQAGRCYRAGLQYAIHGKGERLSFGEAANRPPLQVAG